ncbi:class I SAM-dependent methyltransferase [soil metagenome]
MLQGIARAGVIVTAVVALLPASVSGQLAARPAEDWIKMLDSPARIAGLRIDEVVAKLRLQPGQVVADLGAGTGVFSLPMAKAVGARGKVYAVEVEQGLVDHIGLKAKAEHVPNVQAVLGKFSDPALPAADVDVVFLHDVLHHIEDRTTYLANAAKYLKPDGRFAVVELDPKTGAHRNDPKLQITREELRGWMAALGFHEAEEFPMFEDKWYVTYVRK